MEPDTCTTIGQCEQQWALSGWFWSSGDIRILTLTSWPNFSFQNLQVWRILFILGRGVESLADDDDGDNGYSDDGTCRDLRPFFRLN